MPATTSRLHQLRSRRTWIDRLAWVAALAAAFTVAGLGDLHERFAAWAEQYERYNADELLTVAAGVALVSLAYLTVERRRLKHEVVVRQEREEALTHALNEIELLSGLLAMCSSCKRIRDDDDSWEPVEVYLQRHGELSVSHGICPECALRLYPEYVATLAQPAS